MNTGPALSMSLYMKKGGQWLSGWVLRKVAESEEKVFKLLKIK